MTGKCVSSEFWSVLKIFFSHEWLDQYNNFAREGFHQIKTWAEISNRYRFLRCVVETQLFHCARVVLLMGVLTRKYL